MFFMPKYDYRCENPICGFLTEKEVSISKFKDHHPTCIKCGSRMNYQFNPTVVQFALKDGPTGSWPSKGQRYKNYRTKRSQEMSGRQKDRYGHLNRDCVPNYGGQLTEDWREAQDLAMKDKDNNPDSLATAATYNDKINVEYTKKGSPITK